MGQTLTYGVYLPDEGERNCYSGLAQNWQILDNAVGAIAGKANASHTHGNITNDGAIGSTEGLPVITGTDGVLTTGTFGTASGTFCEGNDSRLSDARTPVAHTHTKSDVTDLLNSNFIPSANDAYDLGSSSYQWNNLYAKNYYYNGTQWGLDQGNVWLNNQIINYNGARLIIKDDRYTMGSTPSTNIFNGVWFHDSTGADKASIYTANRSNGNNELSISTYGSSSSYSAIIRLRIDSANSSEIYFSADTVRPTSNASTDLGTSTNKWKTLNGVNPGALSLPSTSNTDLKPYITSGTAYDYTAPLDGWVCVGATSCTNVSLQNRSKTYFRQRVANSSALAAIFLCIPCQAGDTVRIEVTGTIDSARFHPCLGNV